MTPAQRLREFASRLDAYADELAQLTNKNERFALSHRARGNSALADTWTVVANAYRKHADHTRTHARSCRAKADRMEDQTNDLKEAAK